MTSEGELIFHCHGIVVTDSKKPHFNDWWTLRPHNYWHMKCFMDPLPLFWKYNNVPNQYAM